MKLITIVLFSTLIWPSPFLSESGKKVGQSHTKNSPQKLLEYKTGHNITTGIKHI